MTGPDTARRRAIDADSLPQKQALEPVRHPVSGQCVGYRITRAPVRRLWARLSPAQQRAAAHISRGVEGYAARTGAATIRLGERMDAGVADDTWLLDFVDDYNKWAARCRDYRISRHAVVDVLVRGMPMRRVERAHRRRNGWARRNMVEGLQLFCDMKCWR